MQSQTDARPTEEEDGSRAHPGAAAAVEELRRDIAARVEASPTSTPLNLIVLCDVTASVLADVPSRREGFRLWRRLAWITLRDGLLRWRVLNAAPPSSLEATRARVHPRQWTDGGKGPQTTERHAKRPPISEH